MEKPQSLLVTMPDRSVWEVPVEIIARHRAETFKNEFGNDVERSLDEDTWPLFADDHWEISYWAANNMNWSDVSAHAKRKEAPPLTENDFQEAWVNGEKEVL